MPKWRNVLAEIRFWDKVERRGDDECWEWKGGRWYRGQYGSFYLGPSEKRKSEKAHRYSFLLHNPHMKEVVDRQKLQVLHTCDNTICVNPRHLYVGTNLDNIRDKVERGRQKNGQPKDKEAWRQAIIRGKKRGDEYWTPARLARRAAGGWHNHQNRRKGEKHQGAKLTMEQIQEIRETYQPRKVSRNTLAKRYGVSKTTIDNILARNTYNE